MSRVHRRGSAQIEANLTPMIDMTFLLVVFFVLVSSISEVESVEMELPRPTPSASVAQGDEARSVLNVVPGVDGAIDGYRLGGRDHPASPSGVAALRAQLTSMFRTNQNLKLNVRADRSTAFRHIDPVLRTASDAARAAGASEARVNLVVVVDRGRTDGR